MTTEPTTEQVAAPYGYQPPAVLIRSTQAIGEYSDEISVEIAEGPVDWGHVSQILRELAERRPAAVNHFNGQEVSS